MQKDSIELEPIGHVSTNTVDLADLAPQASDAADATGRVIIRAGLADALLGLDGYRHLWLLTWLHADQPDGGPPLQLIPRATESTGTVQGVFASRAPQRPNSLGLSLVRQVAIEDNVITFTGVDLLDGTPVLDIKPWFADCDLPVDTRTR
jgi:tRNA (adenine37-N6)-methyltransferase